MEEKIDVENLESINIGMIGHIDHGKTTLLQRLTGKWADTHSEELKRGITIKLGYADMIIKDKNGKPLRYVSFIDAPGHEMLMATMLSGSALIDAAILVIAANEGIKPQTREHLAALEARGVDQIIIVQNKIDLVSKEEALKNYEEIKKFIKGTIAENAIIIPCSAQQGINVDKVIEAILNLKVPERDLEEKPIFIVARSFDINKPGTKIEKLCGGVLGGSLKKGVLKEGDEIEIKPGISVKEENKIIYKPVKTKIVSLFKGKYKVKKAKPGCSIAIQTQLDPILTKSDSLSGNVVSVVENLPEPTYSVKIKFKLFDKIFNIDEKEMDVEDIKVAELLMISVNTSITIGDVIKREGDVIELKLRSPIVSLPGSKVGIARNFKGHWRLIGYGEII